MEAVIRRGTLKWLVAFGCALAAMLVISPVAKAGVNGQCPPIADKPNEAPHVNYTGIQHLTYCYGPLNISPGQNVIRLRQAIDQFGQKLWPQQNGYITRFDPELVYADGSVPRVDVLHLHHAVWGVNSNPQFAVGEEKTINQLPQGFGWRNLPSDDWYLNDMLHDLVAQPAQVYVVWRIDFVPDSSPDAATMHTVTTKWLDVAGNPSLYPVFDSLRSYGANGTYTFPDDAPASDRGPCGLAGRAPDSHGCLGAAQSWRPNQNVTLIATAGHLHPGGLNTQLRDRRGGSTNTLFTSSAKYYEPAGEVSWDVAMGATPPTWRVKVPAGDTVSVHATYDTRRADWYEVMGIMPVAVYAGSDVGGKDAQANDIPQTEALTHTHLAENDNHGGDPTGAPNPFSLPSAPAPGNQVTISSFAYRGDPSAGPSVPTVEPGQSLTFQNNDADPAVNAFHTITACKEPCTGTTGIAYPIANGGVTFDSGELGFNGLNGSVAGAPAANRNTWKTPQNLQAGTYTYFCRIHPFMRGAFRVESQSGPGQTLTARKKQKLHKASVTETLSKAGTVFIQAKLKGKKGKGKKKGHSAATSRSLALKGSSSLMNLNAKVTTKIPLHFAKSAKKRIKKAMGKRGSQKIIVTAGATDKWGKTSTAKVKIRLVG